MTSRQVAALTQIIELHVACTEHERHRVADLGERSNQGLVAQDAEQLSQHGRLTCLRLWVATGRDVQALATTSLGARLETLGMPVRRFGEDLRMPPNLSTLRRFETTWLSDSDARALAASAPQLTTLELHPITQKTIAVTPKDDDDDGNRSGPAGGGGGDLGRFGTCETSTATSLGRRQTLG